MADNFYLDDDAGHDSHQMLSSNPKKLFEDYAAAQRNVRKELPRLSMDDPNYSSNLVMLKRTRMEVEEFGRDLGAVNAVVDLPVSADIRRTVAKMFSDPNMAKAISEAEMQRREHQYQLEKEHFSERVNEQLKRERNVLEQELQQLSRVQ